MLLLIVISIIVLLQVVFLIVCLLGFHRAMVNQSPVRAQIEFLGASEPASNTRPALRQC